MDKMLTQSWYRDCGKVIAYYYELSIQIVSLEYIQKEMELEKQKDAEKAVKKKTKLDVF